MQIQTKVKALLSILIKLKEFISVLIFYSAFIYSPSTPDLIIQYNEADFFSEASKAETRDNGVRSIITITLSNNSDKNLDNIDITINDVAMIDSIFGRSSLNKFNEDMARLVSFERNKNNKITLKNINMIPSGHNIQIQMHGSFYQNMFTNRLDVQANTSSISIVKEVTATGFILHLQKYGNIFFSIIVCVGLFVGFRRLDREVEK